MCGIVGIYSNSEKGISYSTGKLVRDMVTADSVRGYDGTGLFFRQYDKKDERDIVYYNKKAVAGTELMGKDAWCKHLDGSRFVVAHNRAATMGAVDDATTHPFMFGPITGVHNGTVHSWRSALKEHIDEATMDSQAIFEALSKIEPDQESIGKLLGSLESGAYSLVWYDNRVDKLRFARNADRPMNFVILNDGIAFGSELRMLEWVIDRNKYKMLRSFATAEHTLIDIPMDGGPAEAHEYSKDIKYAASYNRRSWDAGYLDEFNSYSYGGYHDGYRGPASNYSSYQAATVPRKVLITSDLSIGSLNVETDVKSKVLHACRYMSGTIGDKTGMTISEGLRSMFLDPDYPDQPDWPSASPLVDFHVVDIANGVPIGYIEVSEGDVEPATLVAQMSAAIKEAVVDIVGRGNEAVIKACPLIGIYAYAHGHVAYGLGNTKRMADEVEEVVVSAADAAAWSLISNTVQQKHPEVIFPHNRLSWSEGWATR